MNKFKQSLLTSNQASALAKYGYCGYFTYVSTIGRIATIDDAIDWVRRQYNIVIYNTIEPFVDPVSNKILYRMSVKQCNLRDGWNGRIYIGESKLTSNIYTAKRQAVSIAIRWIKKKYNEKRKALYARSDCNNQG